MDATSSSGVSNITTPESAQPRTQGSHAESSGIPQAPRQEERTTDGQTSRLNSVIGKVLVFLGYRGHTDARARATRRKLVSLVWELSFGLTEVVIILTIAGLGGHESPDTPGVTEWATCKFLGVWNILYIPRIALLCYLSYWTFQRHLKRRAQAQQDAESGRPGGVQTRSGPTAATISSASRATHRTPRQQPRISVHSDRLHILLFNLSSIFATVWFAVAVIGIYSHSYRCRLAAPHLSWVTFAIACILYLRFIKLLLLPAYRICVRSARTDKAVPGKLTQSRVDRIPLVLYIPPPPEDAFESTRCLVPIRPSPSGLKRRFIFLRSLRKRKDINALKGSKEDVQGNRAYAQAAWEDLWERGEHPLVRLEGQRSTCGICLMDFEAPKRILPIPEEGAESAEELADARADAEADQNGDTDAGAVQEVQVEPARQDDTHRVALADSGEGPQPLRLLGCGHAFHKTCVDPWLVRVSGRCPYCQRRIEVPKPLKEERRFWRRSS